MLHTRSLVVVARTIKNCQDADNKNDDSDGLGDLVEFLGKKRKK